MSTVVRIPPTLRPEVGGERQVPASGETVRELLDDLTARFPGLAQQLVEDDDIAPFVNVYVEGEDVHARRNRDAGPGGRDRHPAAGDGRWTVVA